MMFDGITPDRVLRMSEQEQRWFDNVKKAFEASDLAYTEGRAHDDCLPELCKAVDTAKTLRRSLRGEDLSSKENKRRFLEFLNCELPCPEDGGLEVELVDSRSGKTFAYSFAELVYDIRCMVHENENLNAAEGPSYHILIDWTPAESNFFGEVAGGRLTCNGHTVWRRLREIVAKFITVIDGMISLANNEPFSVTISPPLGSVRPRRGSPG
jgi:hypothetical protein